MSLYKGLGIISIGLSIFLAIIIMTLLSRDPVVVVEKCEKKKFHQGIIAPIKISKLDVKEFVKNFIEHRYSWKEFNPKATIKGLSCITTPGLQRKLYKLMGSKNHRNQKGASVSQYISNIEVTLNKNSSSAIFDRIVTINGVPIATKIEVNLQIVKDVKSSCNPFGLYVNGVQEVDGPR